MEQKKLTCIVCPMGCSLTVTLDEGKVQSVSGNTCPRGAKYGEEECIHPTRTLTTTMKVESHDMVSVKSSSPLPKEHLFEYMKFINNVLLKAPVHIGDIVIRDVGGTGLDIVATKSVF